jgi:hypothetical protein
MRKRLMTSDRYARYGMMREQYNKISRFEPLDSLDFIRLRGILDENDSSSEGREP